MYKFVIFPILLITALMFTHAYSQESSDTHLIKNTSGTVLSTDSAGNTISIRTKDDQQLAFIVPDKAVITQQAHSIGLMDIGKSDSVNIQYYLSVPSNKNFVISIVDNESVINE